MVHSFLLFVSATFARYTENAFQLFKTWPLALPYMPYLEALSYKRKITGPEYQKGKNFTAEVPYKCVS